MGFTNPTGILKHFKENDILSCDIDRHTRKRKISANGSPIPVVVIKSEVPYTEVEEARNEYYRRNRQDDEIDKQSRRKVDPEETAEVQESIDKILEREDGKKESKEDTLTIGKKDKSLEEILVNVDSIEF